MEFLKEIEPPVIIGLEYYLSSPIAQYYLYRATFGSLPFPATGF
jgi:hypothetical protein